MEIEIETLKRQGKGKCYNEYNKDGYVMFMLVVSGSCVIDLDSTEHSFEMRDFIIVNPYTKSCVKDCSDDFECYALHVDKNFFEEVIFNEIPQLIGITDSMQRNNVLCLSDKDFSFLLQSYRYIDYCLKQNRQKFFKDIIRYQFTSMILWVLSITPSDHFSISLIRNRQNDIAGKFLKSLKRNFHNEHKVEFYAEDQYITPKYLSTVVKSTTGKTVHGWINKYIILEAKTQLKSSAKTIQEIAIELNFPNQSFFSKYFKKSTNLTPSEYRKLCPC